MPLLLILVALLVPRITLVVLWLLTGWFDGVFATLLWPVLGFLFAPTALLWYSAVDHWFGGAWTLAPIIGMIVALMIDLAPARGRRVTA